MANYSYTARTKDGTIQQGTLTASDRAAALASLSSQNLTPVLIKPSVAGKGLNFDLFKKGGKVKLKDKVVFSRQLATMVNAGVPIVQALNILREQSMSSKRMQAALADATKSVEGGGTLADALAKHPDIFSNIYVNMVRAGETGGILDEVLERLADQQEKDAEIVGKVRGAMIYPSVIATVAIVAFFFIMTVIVPKLSVIFDSLGGKLPIYTRILLGISHFMTHFWYILIGGMIALVVAFWRFHATPRGKRLVDKLLVKTPIIGPIIIEVNVARFARTFGSLLSSGLAVIDAINATKSALNNVMFQEALTKVAQAVKNGKTISEPLRSSKLFPLIVAQMTMVGEETGKLDEILIKVAEFYEREVDTIIGSISSIIEQSLGRFPRLTILFKAFCPRFFWPEFSNFASRLRRVLS